MLVCWWGSTCWENGCGWGWLITCSVLYCWLALVVLGIVGWECWETEELGSELALLSIIACSILMIYLLTMASVFWEAGMDSSSTKFFSYSNLCASVPDELLCWGNSYFWVRFTSDWLMDAFEDGWLFEARFIVCFEGISLTDCFGLIVCWLVSYCCCCCGCRVNILLGKFIAEWLVLEFRCSITC